MTNSPYTLISLENTCTEFLYPDLFCSDKRGEGVSITSCSNKNKSTVRMINQIVSSQKEMIRVSLPITHEFKLKTNLSMMTSKAARYDKLMNSLSTL